MSEDTRREIRKWMALLLGASLCIASVTHTGYANDAANSFNLEADMAEDMEGETLREETPDHPEAAEEETPERPNAAEGETLKRPNAPEEGTPDQSEMTEEELPKQPDIAKEETSGELENEIGILPGKPGLADGGTEDAPDISGVFAQGAADMMESLRDAAAMVKEKVQAGVSSLQETAAAVKQGTAQEPVSGEDTAVMEVADLKSLREAVDMAEAGTQDSQSQEGQWQGRRLLVKCSSEFDPMGAKSMICGYGDIYILDYDSEKEAKKAYKKLKKYPELSVEADGVYCGMQKETDGYRRKTEAAARTVQKGDGKKVCVAVLDTGYTENGYGGERIADGTDMSLEGTVQDGNGHGTAMANIILSQTSDCVLVMPVKVADENGRTSALKLYMGIRYAVENGASVINLSMGAVQASNSGIVREAISQAKQEGVITVVSAGNAGQEVSLFSPADSEDAVVVAAVDAKKERLEYSNYGAGVDYCSYGACKVPGIDGTETECTGTSVSAAIVSGIIAEQKAFEDVGSYEEVIACLDAKAEDLGEPGIDIYYGRGFLAPRGTEAFEETDKETDLPELLACDWRQLSDDVLNEWIGESDELVVRRFLDQKSPKERDEILKRAPVLQSDHVELVCGIDGNIQYRNVDTLYHYLYSDRFDSYFVQTKINGTYYMYLQNATKMVYLATNKNAAKCALRVKFSGTKTNPADNPTITVSGTGAGAFDLAGIRIDGIKTFTDDNGHVNTIGQVGVSGIKIKKEKHSKITGQKKAVALKENHGSDLWSGGFTGFGSNQCAESFSTGCKLMVGVGDLELNKDGKTQTYQITISEYKPLGWGAWSDWKILQSASCFQAGTKQHTHTRACSNCGKTVNTETKTEPILQLSHDFTNAPWNYTDNNKIKNGERWLQCNYACGDKAGSDGCDVNRLFWKKEHQYLQRIFYRYMDKEGEYPEYTPLVDGYFPAGTQIEGFSFAEEEDAEHKTTPGIAGYTVLDQANLAYIDIPRKRYRVLYDGNGANYGSMQPQEVYCGQEFHLSPNMFLRTGYEFVGWSKQPGGDVINGGSCKNLSFTDGGTVTLYAEWKAAGICITLDNQGANLEKGTNAVYERYASGYFKNRDMTSTFQGNRIQIPQKQRRDPLIPEGVRRQRFLGYFTKQDGRGHPFVKEDGFLLADINGSGSYRYFKEDSTVYAYWQDMYAVRFDANLSAVEREFLSKGENGEIFLEPVTCPATRWAGKDEDLTVSYGKAIVHNPQYSDVYRFLGWSLTPAIHSPDDIILDEEMPAYTIHANKDITLYAQWDTSFAVAYIGNGQSSGADYVKLISRITDLCSFAADEAAQGGHGFTKTVQKPAMDIATGHVSDDAGNLYMEEVPYRLLGFSLEKGTGKAKPQEIYTADTPGMPGYQILFKAREAAKKGDGIGILPGELPPDYGLCSVPPAINGLLPGKKMPVVTLYAVWDAYPQIQAADLYLTLSDAQNGILTEPYLLGCAKATDEEMQSGANAEGVLEPGSFTIMDYQEEEFITAAQEMGLTLTYRAEDAVGNVSTKMVHVYLVDTSATECGTGKVRFISGKYADTLAADSVWKTGAYAAALSYALGNKKTEEEYTQVTPVQQALGMKPAKKPGSGIWDHVQEVWEFSHGQVLQIQEYVQSAGVGKDASGFLARFGHCRVQ